MAAVAQRLSNGGLAPPLLPGGHDLIPALQRPIRSPHGSQQRHLADEPRIRGCMTHRLGGKFCALGQNINQINIQYYGIWRRSIQQLSLYRRNIDFELFM